MEQEIIQSDKQDVRLSNLSNGRVLIWYQDAWMVKATKERYRHWNKSLVETEDLQLALKWLKGEQ